MYPLNLIGIMPAKRTDFDACWPIYIAVFYKRFGGKLRCERNGQMKIFVFFGVKTGKILAALISCKQAYPQRDLRLNMV